MAVNQIVVRLRIRLEPKRIIIELTEMREDISQDEAARYERGLTTLGSFLCAKPSKPKGQGRCDSSLEWGTAMWMTIEAKSEERGDDLLPL